MTTFTAPEIAEQFRCSDWKVKKVAREHGIGVNLRGSSGWRFTEADKQQLWDAMRAPKKVAKKVATVRRRRRAA